MRRCLSFLIVAATLMNAACTAQVTSQVVMSPAVSTSTETPEAASTANPSVTASLTVTEGRETPASTPDFDNTATAIVRAVVATSKPTLYGSYVSPDKQWRAEIVIFDCVPIDGETTNAYEQLKLIHISDGAEQLVDSQLQFCGGLGAYGLGNLFWAPNSRYFYYTDAREGVPDGGCGFWERPFIRFDVASQSLERIGDGPLSPDRTKIASWQGNDIVVWDLDQGEMARSRVMFPDAIRGQIVWSPDSQALVYFEVESYCFPFGKSTVVRVDLPEPTSTLLLESEMPTFVGITWDTPNRIKLADENGKEWSYNFETKELHPLSGTTGTPDP